jgi:hypothetical protein
MRTPRQYKVQGSRRSEVADADAGQSSHRSACVFALAVKEGTAVMAEPPSQTPSYIFPMPSHGVTYVYDGYWWLIVPPGFAS